MQIKRLKDVRFGTKLIARVVTGWALYEEGKGSLLKEVNGMTQEQVKELKVGSRVVDLLEDTLEVVKIDGLLYELKWVQEDGSLSRGSQLAVPSHFEYMKLA